MRWAFVAPVTPDQFPVETRDRWSDALPMFNPDRRVLMEFEIITARRRAAEHLPWSPAWIAAMAKVEELEAKLPAASRLHLETRTRALRQA